jgi:hypothetical protein
MSNADNDVDDPSRAWMPFDTAPKDGNFIVILFWDRQENTHEDYRDPEGRWQIGYGRYDVAFGAWNLNFLEAKPWYWLPLPPLPLVEAPDLAMQPTEEPAPTLEFPNEATGRMEGTSK